MGFQFNPFTGTLDNAGQSKTGQIIVRSGEQLMGALVSNRVYFIDAVIDMGTNEIIVPPGGLTLEGHGYDISKLFSTENSYSMFKTPNEIQTLTSDRTGGTFTLTYSGQTTSSLDWDSTAAEVDTALEALSNIGSGDVTCTGGPLPANILIEFTGTLAQTNVDTITVTDSGTGGTAVACATTTAGYAGNLTVNNNTIYVTGTNSKIFDIDNDGQFGALELNTVNLGEPFAGITTTSFGTVAGYRQFRTANNAFSKYTDGFTFDGNMSGLAINDSIALDVVSGSTLINAGGSLSISDGFSSNMNALNISGSSEFTDLSASEFGSGAVMSLANFRTTATDAIPNMDAKNIKSNFRGCVGIENTFIGASWSLTTEATTTITTNKTLVKLAGTTTADLDAHFTMPANNRLQYNGEKDIKVDIIGYCQLSSSNTESFEIEARQWDDSASAFINLRTLPIETALKILGDRRGGGAIVANANMSEGDYIELWALDASAAGTANPTLQLESTLTISERQS